MKTVKKNLTCLLTVEEMKALGMEFAEAAQKKDRLEDDKKQSMSMYKADIDAADALIRSISQKISSGRETRMVECSVAYHKPEEGMKTITRNDTGETVEVLKMAESELEDLFINGLGANREEHFFTFRNRKRVPLVPFLKFQEEQRRSEFKQLVSGTENNLVEYNPEKTDFLLVVDCETVFDLYEFVKGEEVIEAKLIEASNESV